MRWVPFRARPTYKKMARVLRFKKPGISAKTRFLAGELDVLLLSSIQDERDCTNAIKPVPISENRDEQSQFLRPRT